MGIHRGGNTRRWELLRELVESTCHTGVFYNLLMFERKGSADEGRASNLTRNGNGFSNNVMLRVCLTDN